MQTDKLIEAISRAFDDFENDVNPETDGMTINEVVAFYVRPLTRHHIEQEAAQPRMESLIKIMDEIGIYPKAVHGSDNDYEKRTEYMEGWNAAVIEISKKLDEIAARLPVREQEAAPLCPTCGKKDSPFCSNSYHLEVREMTVEEVAKIVMEESSVKVAEHWDYPIKIDLENQTISQDTTQPKVLTSETYRGLDPKMAQTIAQALAKLGTIRVVEDK